MNNYKNLCRFFLISEIVILLFVIFSTALPFVFNSQPIYGYKSIIGFILFIVGITFNLFNTKKIYRLNEISARLILDSVQVRYLDIEAMLYSGQITKDQAQELKNEIRSDIDYYSQLGKYGPVIHIIDSITIICISLFVISKSILLRKPAFFLSYSITINFLFLESGLCNLFSYKENLKILLEETKNLFRNIFKGKITANSKVLYFKQFLSDYSVHRLDSKFYCFLRFGNLLKNKGDILLCPLGEGFKPANPLAHLVVEREGKYLKNALKNLGETEYDKNEFSVFIPCKKLHYKGIIFVCVDFHSDNRADINAKRIADGFLLAKKHECKKLSCPVGLLYEGTHPDSCKEFFSQFDKVIRAMDEDAKKIDYFIEFVIKRNLENYSMFKDYPDFFE